MAQGGHPRGGGNSVLKAVCDFVLSSSGDWATRMGYFVCRDEQDGLARLCKTFTTASE